jgi:hypothetical protein
MRLTTGSIIPSPIVSGYTSRSWPRTPFAPATNSRLPQPRTPVAPATNSVCPSHELPFAPATNSRLPRPRTPVCPGHELPLPRPRTPLPRLRTPVCPSHKLPFARPRTPVCPGHELPLPRLRRLMCGEALPRRGIRYPRAAPSSGAKPRLKNNPHGEASLATHPGGKPQTLMRA